MTPEANVPLALLTCDGTDYRSDAAVSILGAHFDLSPADTRQRLRYSSGILARELKAEEASALAARLGQAGVACYTIEDEALDFLPPPGRVRDVTAVGTAAIELVDAQGRGRRIEPAQVWYLHLYCLPGDRRMRRLRNRQERIADAERAKLGHTLFDPREAPYPADVLDFMRQLGEVRAQGRSPQLALEIFAVDPPELLVFPQEDIRFGYLVAGGEFWPSALANFIRLADTLIGFAPAARMDAATRDFPRRRELQPLTLFKEEELLNIRMWTLSWLIRNGGPHSPTCP